MRRLGKFAACAGIIILLAGCGGVEVDEALLPTRIPTLGSEDFAASLDTSAVESASTNTPTPEISSPTEDTTTDGFSETTATDVSDAMDSSVGEAIDETPTSAEVDDPSGDTQVELENDAEFELESSGDISVTAQSSRTEEPATPDAAVDAGEPLLTATIETETVPAPAPVATLALTVTPDPVSTEEAEPVDAGETPDGGGVAEPQPIDLPEDFASAVHNADPERGQQLTLSSGCIGCHSLDPNQEMVGPTWYNMAEIAANRVDGESADAYLFHSIVNPNAYLVEGYLPNLMIQTYEQQLSQQDIADIVAYLLDLRGR